MAPRSPAVCHWRWWMELHHPLAHRDQRNLQHVPAADLGAVVALIRAHQLQHHHRHQKRGAHPSRHSTEAGYAKESFAGWAGVRGVNKAKHRCCTFPRPGGRARPKSVQPSVKPSLSKDRCVLAVPVLYNYVGRGVLRWLGGVRWCVCRHVSPVLMCECPCRGASNTIVTIVRPDGVEVGRSVTSGTNAWVSGQRFA